jgi:hypothetical protein
VELVLLPNGKLMNDFIPKCPTGNSAEARFMRWVYDSILKARTVDSPDLEIDRTSRGVKIRVKKVVGGGGGWKYRGTFDGTQAYGVNDVVRQKTGGAQGVFICVRDNPVDLNSQTSAAPVYPEPADQNPPTQNIWELLSLGVVQQTSCVGGSNKTIYLNASQPF